ncbi:hypothetical protein [Actibacterium ureilyticum]|uniref:hypothetical protein n=1 Tax=Actibacterium ureilyticum TaxID=1590614 RepID=UPI000BAACBCE|nr:hypothetical protein [Actibacterium ureilyticum]
MRIHPARDRKIIDKQILPFMRDIALRRYPDLDFDPQRSLAWLLGFHAPDETRALHWFSPDLLIALRYEAFSVTRATLWRAMVFAAPDAPVEERLATVMEGKGGSACVLSDHRIAGDFLGHQYRLSPVR